MSTAKTDRRIEKKFHYADDDDDVDDVDDDGGDATEWNEFMVHL